MSPPVVESQIGAALPLSESTNATSKGGTRWLHVVAGSVVTDFVGDALVNAANEGCVSGFGVDEAVNKEGGFELIQARKTLGGCPTGQAKTTPAFGRLSDRVSFVIHAVGPVFRKRKTNRWLEQHGSQSQQVPKEKQDRGVEDDWSDMDVLLVSAYHSALKQAAQAGCRTVGFCLLSAGVFRGDRPLQDICEIALQSLRTAPTEHSSIESVHLFAFTNKEQQALTELLERSHAREQEYA